MHLRPVVYDKARSAAATAGDFEMRTERYPPTGVPSQSI